MLENLDQDRSYVLECIHLGMGDGSIRKDMDSELMLAAVLSLLSRIISRLGEMGDKLAVEYGMSAQSVFTQIYRIVHDGIKAEPSH